LSPGRELHGGAVGVAAVGILVGVAVGAAVAETAGAAAGIVVGGAVGVAAVGILVGVAVGAAVAETAGAAVGIAESVTTLRTGWGKVGREYRCARECCGPLLALVVRRR
jgi:phage-related tail protein